MVVAAPDTVAEVIKALLDTASWKLPEITPPGGTGNDARAIPHWVGLTMYSIDAEMVPTKTENTPSLLVVVEAIALQGKSCAAERRPVPDKFGTRRIDVFERG